MRLHDAVRLPDRIVLAHGFTQTARSWLPIEPLLAARLPGSEIITVDMPGHGDAAETAGDDLWASADLLTSAGGTGLYVGYSMGGRVALHAALRHPDHVMALVLIGATAGIDDTAERIARRRADERLADRIESIGTAAFVDEWLRNDLFAGLDATTDQRDDRLRNRPEALAASLRATGTGTQTPLWTRLHEIDQPVLVLVGEDDAKFTALGDRLVNGLPRAELRVIPGAGHSVQLEQPERTADAIASWWRQVTPAEAR